MVLVQLLGQLRRQVADAVGEGDRGLEPEHRPRPGEVGLRMAYVADAELAGDDRLGPVERGRDRARYVEERTPLATADVEHARGRLAGSRGRAVDGQQRRLDNVAHVHEVAA